MVYSKILMVNNNMQESNQNIVLYINWYDFTTGQTTSIVSITNALPCVVPPRTSVPLGKWFLAKTHLQNKNRNSIARHKTYLNPVRKYKS